MSERLWRDVGTIMTITRRRIIVSLTSPGPPNITTIKIHMNQGPFSIKLLEEISLLTQDHVEVSLVRDHHLESSDCVDIWQAYRHHICRDACQISTQSGDSISMDLAPMRHQSDFTSLYIGARFLLWFVLKRGQVNATWMRCYCDVGRRVIVVGGRRQNVLLQCRNQTIFCLAFVGNTMS